jgi:hypothetical protein
MPELARPILIWPTNAKGYFAAPTERLTAAQEVEGEQRRHNWAAISHYADSLLDSTTFDLKGAYRCRDCNKYKDQLQECAWRREHYLEHPDTMSCELWDKARQCDPEMELPGLLGLTDDVMGFAQTKDPDGWGCVRCKRNKPLIDPNSPIRNRWCELAGITIQVGPGESSACCNANEPIKGEVGEDEGYALDASVRSTDADGRLHIAKSHISKATVNPYYGSEIPNSDALGLDPSRIYNLLRDPVELAAAAQTFARLPILSRHVPVSADAPRQDLVIGAIGSEVEFNDPYLDADLCFWESTAIAGIETDTVRELSCAYRYVAVMEPGTYQGQAYDGRMTEIRGNHLALVESGRAGSDVLAADEAITTMKMTKLGRALFVTLGGMSPKLAQDSALPALVGRAVKKTINAEDVSSKLVAMDADLDPKKAKRMIEALIALDAEKEEKPKMMGEDDDDDDDTVAGDEDDEDDDKDKKKVAKDAEEKMKGAMDSFRRDLREASEAARAVRDVVGDVVAMDSAAEIYAFALDHMKVGHEGVKDAASLKALFNLAQTPKTPTARIAQDTAGMATMFPDANRFVQK